MGISDDWDGDYDVPGSGTSPSERAAYLESLDEDGGDGATQRWDPQGAHDPIWAAEQHLAEAERGEDELWTALQDAKDQPQTPEVSQRVADLEHLLYSARQLKDGWQSRVSQLLADFDQVVAEGKHPGTIRGAAAEMPWEQHERSAGLPGTFRRR